MELNENSFAGIDSWQLIVVFYPYFWSGIRNNGVPAIYPSVVSKTEQDRWTHVMRKIYSQKHEGKDSSD